VTSISGWAAASRSFEKLFFLRKFFGNDGYARGRVNNKVNALLEPLKSYFTTEKSARRGA